MYPLRLSFPDSFVNGILNSNLTGYPTGIFRREDLYEIHTNTKREIETDEFTIPGFSYEENSVRNLLMCFDLTYE